jgi:hypothetical protein
MLNVPVTEELAVRASFQRYQHDPYNKAGGDDAAQTSGRVSALWEHERFKLFASADYTRIGGKGIDRQRSEQSALRQHQDLHRRFDAIGQCRYQAGGLQCSGRLRSRFRDADRATVLPPFG